MRAVRRKAAGQQVRGGRTALAAANCAAASHFHRGFTGLWTNRIGARAAVLGCAKTCPEELHPTHPPAPILPRPLTPIPPVVRS